MSTEPEPEIQPTTKKAKLASNVWLRHGPGGMFGWQEPGRLAADGDQVRFVTKEGVVFEANRADIGVKFPKSEFGGGVHLTVEGKVYRLALVKPKGVPEFGKTANENLSEAARDVLIDSVSELAGAISDVWHIPEGRAAGKAWKEYFDGGAQGATGS